VALYLVVVFAMAGYHKAGSLSRASSTGSLYAQGGSAANTEGPTDDEDSDGNRAFHQGLANAGAGGGAGGNLNQSYRDRRREAHTQAEQKRRDAIKKGYDYLQELVPIVGNGGEDGEATESGSVALGPGSPNDEGLGGPSSGSNGKISKAAVLQRSIDYIHYIQAQKKKQEDELSQLQKEVKALKVMRAQYEQLVKAHRQGAVAGDLRDSDTGDTALPSDVKFEVFRSLMDNLFDSFNDRVSMREFSELSAGVFAWVEEQCKPQLLQEAMHSILETVRDKYQATGTHDGAAAAAAAAAALQQLQNYHIKAETASDPKI